MGKNPKISDRNTASAKSLKFAGTGRSKVGMFDLGDFTIVRIVEDFVIDVEVAVTVVLV